MRETFSYTQIELIEPMAKKNPAAVALGRKGGKNSRKNLSEAERKELAQKAAAARCYHFPGNDEAVPAAGI